MLNDKQSKQLLQSRFDDSYYIRAWNRVKYILFAITLLLILASDANAITKRLSFTDNSSNELGFVVQVCPGSCLSSDSRWKELIKLGPDINTVLIDVAPDVINSYRVGSYNVSGVGWSLILIDRPVSPLAPTITSLLNEACKNITITQVSPGVWQSVCTP